MRYIQQPMNADVCFLEVLSFAVGRVTTLFITGEASIFDFVLEIFDHY